jgi:oligoendopeptidase F
MNYTGSIPHVFALAHETGHAVHDTLLSVHSQLVFESPKPISELASRFAELLLQEKLLEKETDTQMKQNLLVFDLTRCYTAIQRQAAFAIFEKDAHDAVAKGVTIDELANLYFSNLKEQFGNVVYVPENFKWEWETASYICERPFYSYSYAFANLLALAFYNRFKKEGESFKPKYINLLSYGGSESPEKMLAEVGVDIRSEKFWQGGFDAIAGMVSQLEKYK